MKNCFPIWLSSVFLILNVIVYYRFPIDKYYRNRFIDYPLFALIIVYFLCANNYIKTAYLVAILGSLTLIYLLIYILAFYSASRSVEIADKNNFL